MNHPNDLRVHNSDDPDTSTPTSNNGQLSNSLSEPLLYESSTSSQDEINLEATSAPNSPPPTSSSHMFSFLGGVRDRINEQLQPQQREIQTRDTLSQTTNAWFPLPRHTPVEPLLSWIPNSTAIYYAALGRPVPPNAYRDDWPIEQRETAPSNDVIIDLNRASGNPVRNASNTTSNHESEFESPNSNRSFRGVHTFHHRGLVNGRPPPGYGFFYGVGASPPNDPAPAIPIQDERLARDSTRRPSQPNPSTRIAASSSAIATPAATRSHSSSNANRSSTSRHTRRRTRHTRSAAEIDDDHAAHEIVIKFLSHFIRYLPFIGILLLKSVYDHWLSIIDLVFLQLIVYQTNKVVCDEVAKGAQKNMLYLCLDYVVVISAIIFRFLIAHSRPDYLGLLINIADDRNSLIQLLFAVAVNDLVLKLITIKLKILITMLPDIMKQSARGRLLAFVEALSQMYRSLVPVKPWLLFLLMSYTGLEINFALFIFSSLYMGAKAFELVQRGKYMKKTFCSLIRNVDFGRKPTKEELAEVSDVCPICHDLYKIPVVLECNHIFCEACVGTWFKREQTCPMCRSKVADDPTWQTGSTSLFYQLC